MKIIRKILLICMICILSLTHVPVSGPLLPTAVEAEAAAKKVGWKKINGKTYYFQKSGKVTTGFKWIGGKYYYFNSKGVLLSGWLKYKGRTYYQNKNGIVVTGFQTINKKKYYFYKSTSNGHYLGQMCTETSLIGGKVYTFKSNGVIRTVSSRIYTPTSWVTSKKGASARFSLLSRKGKKTITFYRQDYWKDTYMKLHGCTASSIAAVIQLYSSSSKYKKYTAKDIHYKLEKAVFGKISSEYPPSAYGTQKLLKKAGVNTSYIRSFTRASARKKIQAAVDSGNAVIVWLGPGQNLKWTGSVHTVVILGQTDKGRLIVADSCDRKWAGNNQRLKIVSMNDVVNSMMSNTRQKDTNYWSGWTNSHGFLVVKK